MSNDLCPTEEQLYALVAGDGSAAQDAHVQNCGHCQGLLHKLQSEATILQHVGQEKQPSDVMQPSTSTPATIGKFVVTGEWHDGPVFVTYRGIHAVVRQDVLLQVAKEPRGEDPAGHKAFYQACASWMQPRRHVAPVVDAGVYDSRAYVVVRFSGGVRLDRLVDERELDGESMLLAFGQAAQALASGEASPHPRWGTSSLVLEENGDVTIVDWAAAVMFDSPGGDMAERSLASTPQVLAAEFCRAVLKDKSVASGTPSPPTVAELASRLAASGIRHATAELVAQVALVESNSTSSAATLTAISKALLIGRRTL